MKRSTPEISSARVKRSRTSCSQCRQRKIKCDESTPTCGPCHKGSRLCEQRPWIIFHKETLRDKNGQESLPGSKKSSQKVSSTLRSATEGNFWVQIPERVEFIKDSEFGMAKKNDKNDFSHPVAPVVYSSETATPSHHGKPWTEARAINIPPNLNDGHESNANLQNSGANEYLGSIRPAQPNNRSQNQYPKVNDTNSMPQTSPESTSFTAFTTFLPAGDVEPRLEDLSGNLVGEEEDLLEIAFLLRHFSETPGQWMDLFDLDCYFARQVPILARRSRLLRYASCAYAAKQLGRVGGTKAARGGVSSRQARMEVIPKGSKTDWYYRGNKYYDKALSLLRNQISLSEERDFSPSKSPHNHRQNPSTASRRENLHQLNRTGNDVRFLSDPTQEIPDTTITVVAAAVLCVYEFLDAANVEWAGHLDGTKSLLDIAFAKIGGLFSPQTYQLLSAMDSPARTLTPSKARKAAFWNFARQDYLAAFINETTTRLDTEDIDLWRTAGLELDGVGFIRPSNLPELDLGGKQEQMREDMISNALIWLLSKLVNFLVSNGRRPLTSETYPHRSSQQRLFNNNLVDSWKRLQEELDVWFNGLPETFQASAEIVASQDGCYNEIWYSIPMCASAIQSYHMARILLLINKPEEYDRTGSNVLNMIHSYRGIEEELRYHCSKICGIALGRPEGATRVHMLQPLYVAGLCLTDTCEQRIVADLLKEIETDLGWATGYRVRRLTELWNWEEKDILQ